MELVPKLDVPDAMYDRFSHPHIIPCLGEHKYGHSADNAEWEDDMNKYGSTSSSSGKFGEMERGRVDRASSKVIRKRLPIIEAKRWSRQTIALVQNNGSLFKRRRESLVNCISFWKFTFSYPSPRRAEAVKKKITDKDDNMSIIPHSQS